MLGSRTIVRTLGQAIAAACDGSIRVELAATLPPGSRGIQPATLARTVLDFAPTLAAIAVIAVLAHVAQTRTLWLPRRRIAGAPTIDRGVGARVRIAALEIASAAAIGGAAFGWLWIQAPRISGLFALDAADRARGVTALGVAFLACLAITWLSLGVVDAVARHVELAHALAMTAAEKHEDDRLAAADPRWAKQRAALARTPAAEPAVRDAAVVLLGEDLGIAIAWHPLRQPIPTRVANGRGIRATQLVGLARRHGIAVHRDPTLVAGLGPSLGPVPEHHWARLAEIIAAVRR